MASDNDGSTNMSVCVHLLYQYAILRCRQECWYWTDFVIPIMAGDDGISLTNGGFTEGLVKFGSGMRIQT